MGLGVWSLLPSIALAQITPDGSLGAERSQLTRSPVQGAPAELISGGARRGGNLFHSFSEFNVGDRQRVYFANPVGVQNILSRVTGRNPSNIFGTLGVNGTANLFLINPNGILFGSNARLDMRGSFLASTAAALIFDNGFRFSSTNPQAPPLLTINIPIGLQFGASPGGIRLQGVKQTDLRVGTGQTLALVGGELMLDGGGLQGSPPLRCPDPSCAPRVQEGGGLTAPGGRIELGSVAAGSLVTIAPANPGWELGYQGVPQFQDIRLSRAARVEVNGSGGSIQVQGRRITLTDGAQIITLTQGSQTGRNLTIRAAESLTVAGFDRATGRPSRIANETTPGSTGNAGNLTVETQNLRVIEGGVISSGTAGAGQGGNLSVWAKSIEVIGSNSLDRRLRIPSSIVNQASQGSTGNAGNLTIETESLRVVDGAAISVGTFAPGNGGNLTVRAQSIEVIGPNPLGGTASNLAAQSFRESTGNAGNIVLISDRLYVAQGEIRTGSVTSGSAGNITIESKSQITLADDGRIRADTNTGEGNISLTTPLLLMRRGSRITTNAAGSGTGGNITINAGFIVSAPNENNDIIANAIAGSGGKITIAAQGLLGFNLRTRPELQRLLNTTNPTQLDPRRLRTNDITAFSQANPTIDTGSVTLQTPNLDPTRGLTTLPTDLTDPSQLIAATCPADQGSSFAITGRGGIPEDPRQPLIGQVVWQDERSGKRGRDGEMRRWGDGAVEGGGEDRGDAIVEAQGWVVDRTGSVMLIAEQASALIQSWYPACALKP